MKRIQPCLVVVVLVPGCLGPRHSAKEPVMPIESGFVAKSLTLVGRTHRYMVFVPPEYTAERAWPAMLYMHGIGERGEDGERHTHHGLGKAIRAHPERFPCVVILPQCPLDHHWEGPMLEMASAALDAAQKEYRLDPDRIALTGLSMGGFGTWSLAARNAGRFSCAVPICGGGDPASLGGLATLPIWCFHGDADPVIPVQRSREMVDAVRAAGGSVRYTELAGVTHNSWDPAYADPELIGWMLAQQRMGN